MPPLRPQASCLQLPAGNFVDVLDCLCAHFPHVGEARWRDRFARGRVQDADGRSLAPDTPYRVGLEIRYWREVDAEVVVPFAEDVLWVDAHLVVADKPHFLPVSPTGRWVEQTLLRRLQHRLGVLALVPLHRLDRATAGLVLFSADPTTRAAYHDLFKRRAITKSYLALAPALPAMSFPHTRRSALARGEPFFRVREIDGPANTETTIEVIDRGPRRWLYRLTPVTGHKHQLRVHMAALGAPIDGDTCYPELQPEADDDYARPLALLASELRFVDPVTGVPRHFTTQRRLAAN